MDTAVAYSIPVCQCAAAQQLCMEACNRLSITCLTALHDVLDQLFYFWVSGGLDKLADIISPAAEDQSVKEAAMGTLQRSLKGVQAVLEDKQAAVFGEQVCSSHLYAHAPCRAFCHSSLDSKSRL